MENLSLFTDLLVNSNLNFFLLQNTKKENWSPLTFIV